MDTDSAAVLERARALLAQGAGGSGRLAREGRLARPVAVRSPSHDLDSWFVAVLVDDRMAGFVQLTPDLRFERCSEFPTPVDPSLWLDADRIRATAGGVAGPDARLSDPWLSYDGARARIAWRVDVETPDGERAAIFVVGDFAYATS